MIYICCYERSSCFGSKRVNVVVIKLTKIIATHTPPHTPGLLFPPLPAIPFRIPPPPLFFVISHVLSTNRVDFEFNPSTPPGYVYTYRFCFINPCVLSAGFGLFFSFFFFHKISNFTPPPSQLAGCFTSIRPAIPIRTIATALAKLVSLHIPHIPEVLPGRSGITIFLFHKGFSKDTNIILSDMICL